MKHLKINKVAASLIVASVGLTASASIAAEKYQQPQTDLRASDSTLDWRRDQNAGAGDEAREQEMQQRAQGEEINSEESRSEDARRGWHRKRRHADRGNRNWRGQKHRHRRGDRRLYEQDMTKGQFFERMQQRFASLDVDGSGSIENADVEAYLDNAKNSGRRMQRRGGRLFRRMERLDRNQDGKVTMEEYFSSVERRFARLDRNSDGRLNQNDLTSTQ